MAEEEVDKRALVEEMLAEEEKYRNKRMKRAVTAIDLGKFNKPKGKPIRTVIVHDALFDGDMKQAAALQDLLEDYAEGFLDYVKANNPEVAAKFVIEQTQAAIPFKTERRGLTGSLEELVFRGSRGKNFNPDRAPIPKDTPAGVKQKLYSYRQFLENKALPKHKIENMLEDRKNKLIEQLMENQMRSVGDYGD
jgi:hypothetical protein